MGRPESDYRSEGLEYDHLDVSSDFINKSTNVREDGRIDVNLDSRLARTLSKLVPAPPQWIVPLSISAEDTTQVKLNIVIQVVGSRGDVQPFIALGCELQKHGHRVRLATHNIFDDFVRKSGLEFYSIGGDPAELMAYMVKNPGLIPSMKSLRAGDIQLKRKMISEMLSGCWKSCIESDALSGAPFVADAIIANPPSFAHVHCAQALGIPVHLIFTMPWTSTRAFPQPIANLKYTSTDPKIANYISYGIVDFMTWQGLGDVINSWRKKTLDLEHVPLTEGPGLLDTLEIPFTYCWSPALVAKPPEWGPHIDPPDYKPSEELNHFLQDGVKPIYIGFGSIVIDDPSQMTQTILDAVKISGVRAIVSRGWSRLGGAETSSNVFYLDDCPHEWLFQHVAAVVHHGGAGTTACGLLNGKPTSIIPFFGDQPFWGNMVAAASAGPLPIPQKQLNSQNLAEAIEFCLTPEAAVAAEVISQKMKTESGVKAAVRSFHNNLPAETLQCDLIPSQPATWKYQKDKKKWKISKLAASILATESKLNTQSLEIYESKPILIDVRRWDPVTATASASVKTVSNMVDATVGIVRAPIEEYKRSHKGDSLSSSKTASAESSRPTSITSHRESVVLTDADPKANHSGLQVAGAMALASAGSLGKVFVSTSKGILVDIPLAMTEGLQSLPRYYDTKPSEKEKNNMQVTGIQSGVVMAGKSFGGGVYEGVTDVFKYTWNGKKEEGAKGVAKGLGKGLVSFTAKVGGGVVGLIAYPGRGVEKSVMSMVRGHVRKEVRERRLREGVWMLKNGKGGGIDSKCVVAKFGNLK